MEKTKILIAEYESVNLKFFEITLSKLGFTVFLAEDGAEALEMIKNVKPDLIILDTKMPKISGWKVTSLLKESEEYSEYKDIPIIMLSEDDSIQDKVEGIELGVEDYITKPFNFYEIYARIRAVVKNRILSKHLVEREKRLATVESLNESLTYFTEHIKNPTLEIKKLANSLDLNNKQDVVAFVNKVVEDSDSVLAAIESLKEEIKEIENRNDEDFSIAVFKELEEKFKKRYEAVKDQMPMKSH